MARAWPIVCMIKEGLVGTGFFMNFMLTRIAQTNPSYIYNQRRLEIRTRNSYTLIWSRVKFAARTDLRLPTYF